MAKSNAGGVPLALDRVESRIYLIRGQKVLLSGDLAELYGVSAKRLNEAVKRNRERFPTDFHVSAIQSRGGRGFNVAICDL